jgi:2,5-diamino-6-(ribosylamino)-4(3H)-pyrimidinone 5'-phosphate reductase
MRPRVIVYNAVSLDGGIDGFQPDIGLYYSLVRRFGENATLAGCETLLNSPDPIPEEAAADLAPRAVEPGDQRPMLVVADSRGRLRTWHYWKRQPYWRRFVSLCTEKTPLEHRTYLKQRHVECLDAGADRIDFGRALERLHAEYGVTVVRVESGGTLNGVLLRAGLVDEVHLLIHPAMVGDIGRSFFRSPGSESSRDPIALKLKAVEQHANDMIMLSYDVAR